MDLHSFLELGKQITGSPQCEIDITDWHYQWILTHKESDIQNKTSLSATIFNDTVQKNSSVEIEDLSKDGRYKNHKHVIGKPWFRHFFGMKLTTAEGRDIGIMSVSDPVSKRITEEQKVQFKLLAHIVMTTIESESRHQTITGEFDSLKKNLHRLNHDVRSPINGITGMVDLLIDGKEEISVRTRDILMIKESAQSIIEIITEVIAAGDQKKNNENWPKGKQLSQVIEKIEKLFNPLAKSKNVPLSLTYRTEHKVRLPNDFSVKLVRIIGNLVSNAIKFSPENDQVKVVTNVISNNRLTTLNITVENAGRSMTSEQIHSFTSGEAVTRTNGHGKEESFGLGLQHVYRMVSEEGGSVNVEKRDSSGTKFSITLPVPEDKGKKEKTTVHDPFVNIGYAKPTVNGNH